jgi:glutaconate CoA-transferase subunit B
MAAHSVDVTMVVAMAREVRPGDWVSHGAAVPLAGAALYLAIETHAPDVEFWIQGCVSPTNRNLADALIEPERILPTARAHMSQTEIINFELRGNGLFQFLRPLQIDPFGNINASLVERPGGVPLRFHGVAVGDALNIVRRVCLYVTEHTPRVFTERLRYRTATGHHDGSEWRPSHGIKPSGPVSVVTPLAVLDFGADRRLRIRSVHRGHTVDEVQAATGFELAVAERVDQTPEPTAFELAALERVDPDRIRLLEFRATRPGVLRRLAEMQEPIKESV